MTKLFVLSLISFLLIFSSAMYSSAEINLLHEPSSEENMIIEIAKKGRLFIGMTKTEAYEVEGLPYRTKRMQGEEGKEMWIYRCNNDDGIDEDCLYLYFNGDELDKIERP